MRLGRASEIYAAPLFDALVRPAAGPEVPVRPAYHALCFTIAYKGASMYDFGSNGPSSLNISAWS